MSTSLAFMGLVLILVTSIFLRHHLQDPIDFVYKSVWLICLLLLGIFSFLLSIFSLNQVLCFFIVVGLISFLWSKVLRKGNTQLLFKEISKVSQKLFPWFLLLVVLRLFLGSFYYIPSYSMEPTLKTGDIVVVLPENSIYFWGGGKKEFIQRGQVIVFRDPKQKINLIKRVIAIPGDVVIYHNKTLLINGEKIKKEFMNKTLNTDFKKLSKIEKPHELLQFKQYIESKTFDIFEDEQLIDNNAKTLIQDKNCILIAAGVKCDVPENQYFVLGDNRDDSLDSRHHGLINQRDIYGKAVYILINIAQFNRFFQKIK